MKKYLSIFILTLFLVGCGGESRPSLEERMASSEAQISLVDELEDSTAELPSSEAIPATPNLTLKDPNQSFEKYLPTLMFHYIEAIPSDSSDQMRYKLSFSPEKLEAFLSYFKENKIQTLTYHDLIPMINGELPFPEKAVMLTFDDGYDDHYSEAFRLLKKYDMKGVFFIISGKPDQDPEYATWAQVKEMADAGQEIGSHTVTHPSLTTVAPEAQRKELEESKEVLEEKIGKPVISLAYPGGDYNQATLDSVKEIYTFARTTEAGKDFSLQKRYELPTVRIFPETGVASLKIWFE